MFQPCFQQHSIYRSNLKQYQISSLEECVTSRVFFHMFVLLLHMENPTEHQMNQISIHFQFTVLLMFSLFLQSSAFLRREDEKVSVGMMLGAILKVGRWLCHCYYQISVRFYESYIYIYPNRRVTSHYPNLPVFAVFCSLLRFCSLLTCWGQLDPIIRISHLLNIKGQLVLLIPLPGEFLSELSGTSLELLRDHTQSHVGGSILLLAQFKNHVLMQRTWKD